MTVGTAHGRPLSLEDASSDRDSRLAERLRTGAARTAQRVGGIALVFVSPPDSDRRAVRAAAGFSSPEAARAVAESVEATVIAALESGTMKPCPSLPELFGTQTEGTVVPLTSEGRIHGALVAASPRPIDDRGQASLQAIAETLAVRLDHAWLADRVESLRSNVDVSAKVAEERSDEILKLSEALFAQDIELLQSNEKLEKIEKLKNDFIEKMSRELRTPLNSIIESIISVLAGENENLSESAKTGLREALDEGTAFLRTLQNILDLWKIKQGELPLEVHEVNFREVVEEAIFSVQDTIGENPVVIEREIIEPFPKIRTDLAKLNHVLFLLLDNAAKFTNRGTISIQARIERDQLVCEVRDTGIGISPDDQQLVFDEFFQVDELASTRYRGAGLGMALVRDLLVLMDGEVKLSSEVGKGTSLTFRIPVQPLP